MNKRNNNTLLFIGIILITSIVSLGIGYTLGRSPWSNNAIWPSHMSLWNRDNSYYGMPMMYGYRGGYGMMGSQMMDGYNPRINTSDPITLDEAEKAADEYISQFGGDLSISEVMIFDNHAYVQIVENETGIGAMEILIDPVTLAVYPEYGPNMMWNLKYGMMNNSDSFGMMGYGGMMGGYQGTDLTDQSLTGEMPVDKETAVKVAQDYLNAEFPGFVIEEHPDQFYGYYTLHINNGGNVVGMLSVNGYTRQIFVHTWHGDFISMSEE